MVIKVDGKLVAKL